MSHYHKPLISLSQNQSLGYQLISNRFIIKVKEDASKQLDENFSDLKNQIKSS